MSLTVHTPKRAFEVVVVGAGASGLSAARELEANGIKSIIILEASDYVGGRVNTLVPPSGGFIDLGAQWIHGQLENSLYSIAYSKDLIGNYLSVDGEGDFYTDLGEKLSRDLLLEVRRIYYAIKKECQSFVTSDVAPPLSVGHYFRSRFNEYLKKEMDPNKRKLKEALFHWYMRWERVDNACDSMHQLSAKRWEYVICKGFDNMNTKSGMSSILFSIKNEIKAEIRLETEVTEIDYGRNVNEKEEKSFSRWNSAFPVVVHCRNGNQYECNHVIVTCSLGYLKKHKDHLFKPPLPSPTDRAISNIGYGVLDKIFLEFEKPFWGQDLTGIHLVWTGNEIPDFERTNSHTRLTNGESLPIEDYWYRAISGFDPIFGHKSILCGWICGAEAAYMETLDEEEVGRVCVRLLRRFTRKPIPDPIRVYRSQWSSNEFTRGSFSHRLVSSDTADEDWIKTINEPIWAPYKSSDQQVPLIVFAGEAYHPKYYSTVHGAISNGASQARYYKLYRERFENKENAKSKL